MVFHGIIVLTLFKKYNGMKRRFMFSFSSLFPLNGVPYTVNEFKEVKSRLVIINNMYIIFPNDSATGGYALTCRRRNLRKKDCFYRCRRLRKLWRTNLDVLINSRKNGMIKGSVLLRQGLDVDISVGILYQFVFRI